LAATPGLRSLVSWASIPVDRGAKEQGLELIAYRMQTRRLRWFPRTPALVLLLTGVSKICSGFGQARLLWVPDTILGLAFGRLLLLDGTAEVAVGVHCFVRALGLRLKMSLIAWIATTFLLYRLELWLIGWHRPCGCMGRLAGVLHLSDQAADSIMKGVLGYLLIGSYGILLWQWRQRRAEGRTVLPALSGAKRKGRDVQCGE
jgi:hypothetical protein